MSEQQIVEVDPFDPDQFDPWHHAYLAAELAAPPGVTSPWQLEEVRAMMHDQGTRHRLLGYAGVVDGRVVTSGFLRLPLLDNTDAAELMVHVVPDARRRGYGSAMLAHLEQVASEHGRTVLQVESSWPYDAGHDGAGEPGPSFAAARAYGKLLPAGPLYLAASAMAFSRLYLGVHYPSDIAAGAALGSVLGTLGRR